MPRPNGCPECGGTDLEPEIDRYMCLSCGLHIDFHGNALPCDPEFRVPQRTTEVQHG